MNGSSLSSGISGLSAHQQRMDVIANDIANVNTVGYKESEVTFRESLVETITAPAANRAGQQLGSGVTMGLITRDFGGGALAQTGLLSNLALQNDGFFVVQQTDAAGVGTGNQFYTRAGDFVLDAKDPTTVQLITSSGYTVLGTDGQPLNLKAGMAAGVDLVSYTVAADGTVSSIGSDGAYYPVGAVAVVSFQNNNGLLATGGNMYQWTAAASATQPALTGAANASTVSIMQGYLENSNVDLAREFTDMIITQRGYQANSKTITTADEMMQVLLGLKR
jgi:flagellar hook protein FlgE